MAAFVAVGLVCRRDSVRRPVARFDVVTIHLCGLPGGNGRAARPLFDLAPSGVCRAAPVTRDAGALLPHRCTLTCAPRPPRRMSGRPSAVCSLWHFPAPYDDWPLASTLPCGVPTFLDVPFLWSAAVTRPGPPPPPTVPAIAEWRQIRRTARRAAAEECRRRPGAPARRGGHPGRRARARQIRGGGCPASPAPG